MLPWTHLLCPYPLPLARGPVDSPRLSYLIPAAERGAKHVTNHGGYGSVARTTDTTSASVVSWIKDKRSYPSDWEEIMSTVQVSVSILLILSIRENPMISYER